MKVTVYQQVEESAAPLEIEGAAEDTVSDLKRRISAETKLPVAIQCLLVAGRELQDEQTFEECFTTNQIVHLVLTGQLPPERLSPKFCGTVLILFTVGGGCLRRFGIKGILKAFGVTALLSMGFMKTLSEKLYASISPMPPTAKQLQEEDFDAHPLFRCVPALKGKIAWRQLGTFPTPIHKCTVSSGEGGACISFLVKREDLSSSLYGGNKVRTLQHQLASVEAAMEAGRADRFVVVGSGGSNQCVATLFHGETLGVKADVQYLLKDVPDLDNTMNFMSCASLGVRQNTWERPVTMLKTLVSSLFFSGGRSKVAPLGGNQTCGVLGQIGAALELAEQISSGEVPDPEAIYLPIGSSCTITGLTLGVGLAQHLGMDAFRHPRFKIVGCPVGFGTVMAFLHAPGYLNRKQPFTLASGIERVGAFIVDNGGPEIRPLARRVHKDNVEVIQGYEYVGPYGSHSQKSFKAARVYDTHGKLETISQGSSTAPHLWLCGHFAAKAYAVMMERLEAGMHVGPVLFWQTKSATQPLARKQDEMCVMEEASDSVKRWATCGPALSSLRQGTFNLKSCGGVPDADYRKLMRVVTV